IDRDEHGHPWRVWISAQTGDGFDLLFQAIAERLAAGWVDCWVRLPASAGRLRARLHEAGEVLEEQAALDGSMLLRINVNRVHFERLLREQGLKEEELVAPAPAVAGDDASSYNSQRSHDASHQ
ncbi:MAG TPA: GTPase HflX, partial [Alcanivorax sp.]|nr:GTPase HflX [Alcanivorax sp.]